MDTPGRCSRRTLRRQGLAASGRMVGKGPAGSVVCVILASPKGGEGEMRE